MTDKDSINFTVNKYINSLYIIRKNFFKINISWIIVVKNILP